MALASLPVASCKPSPDSSDFLKGSWTLQAAYEIRPDGTFAYPYGTKPQGILMVDREGRYTVEIYDGTRPKFPSPTPTPEQYKAAFLSMSVHTGRAEVDRLNHLLIFHVAHNASPDRDGTVQTRPYELKGDVLTYRVPAATEGTINIPVSVWKRVAGSSDRDNGRSITDQRDREAGIKVPPVLALSQAFENG